MQPLLISSWPYPYNTLLTFFSPSFVQSSYILALMMLSLDIVTCGLCVFLLLTKAVERAAHVMPIYCFIVFADCVFPVSVRSLVYLQIC